MVLGRPSEVARALKKQRDAEAVQELRRLEEEQVKRQKEQERQKAQEELEKKERMEKKEKARRLAELRAEAAIEEKSARERKERREEEMRQLNDEMVRVGVSRETLKRKKAAVTTDEEDELEVVSNAGADEDNEGDADADADDEDNETGKRKKPLKTNEVHNPPCARCQRMRRTCWKKDSDGKAIGACWQCACHKTKCEWNVDDEMSDAAAVQGTSKALPAKPMSKGQPSKPMPTPSATMPTSKPNSSKPAPMPVPTSNIKNKASEPPRKKVKKSVTIISESDGPSGRPTGTIRVIREPHRGTNILKSKTTRPTSESAADRIPRFSEIEDGKTGGRCKFIILKGTMD